VVPNEVVLEEEIEFGEGRLDLEDPGEDERLREGSSEATTAARPPDTDARLFRAVQPDYPETAREQGVRARVRVSVQVSTTGRVEHATVLKRWRLLDEGQARPVDHLEHGLEQAALVAARRSRFRPAQHNGTPVATQTTLTFKFGTGDD
jgi:outer membrane biosynthesis protein TonB